MNLGNRYAQHSFAQIPSVNLSRSQFDRSYQRKQTMGFNALVPIFIDEIIPGDTVNLSVKTFSRLITQVAPLMDRIYLDYFFFFVPNRLVWQNWERFCGAQDNPGDSTSYVIPSKVLAVNTVTAQSLFDYMGLPLNTTGQVYPTGGQYTLPNVLPIRAYALIWNQWFRDQNLQNSVTVSLADGPDTTTNSLLLGRNLKQDYFTSALPWPQKGTAVSLPLGTSAPVFGTGKALGLQDASGNNYGLRARTSTNLLDATTTAYNVNTGGSAAAGTLAGGDQALGVKTSGVSGLYADLSTATAATINQLRQSMLIQGLLELDARGGTRYTEILANHYQVISPDFRLQRAEYLGGGREYINSHPVPITSTAAGGVNPADLKSFGTAATSDNSIGFTKSFVEHGYVIGLVSARGEMSYQQGMERMWLKSTRYDFFWPKLQQLGEQAIYNGEIWWQQDSANSNFNVFGYQERYSEYKYKPSQIIGQFRSQFATPLDQWHLAPVFTSQPALNSSFLATSTPIDRNLAVPGSQARILQDLWFDYKHARPMMSYAVPSTLGRF